VGRYALHVASHLDVCSGQLWHPRHDGKQSSSACKTFANKF
jgi:hypothetical protein